MGCFQRPYPAERFFRYTKIGSYIFRGHTLNYLRRMAHDKAIFFYRFLHAQRIQSLFA